MMIAPVASACASSLREYFISMVPAPIWIPIRPRFPSPLCGNTAPASPAMICATVALGACLAECCMYTCDISCAITPANSASLSAAVMVPRLMKIGPPGSANALMSAAGITWNWYGHDRSAGMTVCSFRPSCWTYRVSGLESGNTGICLYTSPMACRPSFSCCSLFIPGEPGSGSCGCELCPSSANGCVSSNDNTSASARVENLRDCICILKNQADKGGHGPGCALNGTT